MEQWNEFLRKARTARGVSEADLAGRLGIEVAELKAFEEGSILAELWRGWTPEAILKQYFRVLGIDEQDAARFYGVTRRRFVGFDSTLTEEPSKPRGLDDSLPWRRSGESPDYQLIDTAPSTKQSGNRHSDDLRLLISALQLNREEAASLLKTPVGRIEAWLWAGDSILLSPVSSTATATIRSTLQGVLKLQQMFLPERLPEVIRRPARLFDGERALDWILAGRIDEVVERYSRLLSYQA